LDALFAPFEAGTTDQPFVIAQLGQSLDGRIATLSGDSKYINGASALDHLHRLRARVDAVVVGVGTVVADDPLLTVRRAGGRNPARVVLDPNHPGSLEPGDVLVCPITDPSWTPLFLSAGAVACESGSIQSHAAIIARELGVPAVLSVAGITAVADGTQLCVDGDRGTVTVG